MLLQRFPVSQLFSQEMVFEAFLLLRYVNIALSSFAYCSHQYYRFGNWIYWLEIINYITISLQMSQYVILMGGVPLLIAIRIDQDFLKY
jgi:hypothetical protein